MPETTALSFSSVPALSKTMPEPPAVTLGQGEPFTYCPGSAMEQVLKQIPRLAPRNSTVLITGETGTGKSRLARLIHQLSPRRDEPFLAIDFGSLAPALIESELFGHARGSFTGAMADRRGKFEEAGRGTVLLDEVDALPLILQAKLLRAVDERVFEPVGSNKCLPLQARMLVATSRPLEMEVAAGRFRSDLYYRLNVVCLFLPPLRERPQVEIEAIAKHFVAQFTSPGGRALRFTTQARRALLDYSWPGNIRELRNVIERAVALGDGQSLRLEDLPPSFPAASSATRLEGLLALPEPDSITTGTTLQQTRHDAEAIRITQTLERHHNNRRRAAAELGISRMTLYRKLHRYGLIEWAKKPLSKSCPELSA
jgi:two-component system response regulator PilR (NtrC family)